MIVTETFEGVADAQGAWQPVELRTWAAREALVAKTTRQGERLIVESSGNPGCFGGWDLVFDGFQAEQWYRFGLAWEAEDLPNALDSMPIFVFWQDGDCNELDYDYLLVRSPETSHGRAERVLQCPEGATRAVLRFGVRWTPRGRAVFSKPSIEPAQAPEKRIARVAVATARPQDSKTVEDNVRFWCAMVREAAEHGADLVLLPEVITVWTLARDVESQAQAIPGPATQQFARVARECDTMIAFSMHERDGDLFFNTGIVFSTTGEILGRYRKSHVAIHEGWKGISPGDEIPVFDTQIGKLSMNICKDTGTPEAARIPALKGAEMMLIPIMGDYRAVDWRTSNRVVFSPERWKIIMQARAIDNAMWVVAARALDDGLGSCIVAPSGDIVAFNDGGQRVIVADCDLSERLRPYRGSSFSDAQWAERRPQLYGILNE